MDKQETKFMAVRTSIVPVMPDVARLVQLKRGVALLRYKLAMAGRLGMLGNKEETNG